MPRIAAALGVVITIAACIGFNTVRYPVVLEMAASSGGFPFSSRDSTLAREEQDPAADSTAVPPVLAALSGSAGLDDPGDSLPPGSGDCDWDTHPCESDESSDVNSRWGAESYRNDWDDDGSCEPSAADPHTAEFSTQPEPGSLIPVAGSDEQMPSGSGSGHFRSESNVSTSSMFRLPTTNRMVPSRYHQESAELGDRSIPFYPSTE